jgi:hypothetical protein
MECPLWMNCDTVLRNSYVKMPVLCRWMVVILKKGVISFGWLSPVSRVRRWRMKSDVSSIDIVIYTNKSWEGSISIVLIFTLTLKDSVQSFLSILRERGGGRTKWKLSLLSLWTKTSLGRRWSRLSFKHFNDQWILLNEVEVMPSLLISSKHFQAVCYW